MAVSQPCAAVETETLPISSTQSDVMQGRMQMLPSLGGGRKSQRTSNVPLAPDAATDPELGDARKL